MVQGRNSGEPVTGSWAAKGSEVIMVLNYQKTGGFFDCKFFSPLIHTCLCVIILGDAVEGVDGRSVGVYQ